MSDRSTTHPIVTLTLGEQTAMFLLGTVRHLNTLKILPADTPQERAGMNNIVLFAAIDAETAAKTAGGTLENRLRAAMQATANHWMATNEEDQFNGAMQGCARTCDDAEREVLEAEIERLNLLSAMMSNVPVGIEAITARLEAMPESIGAQKMWREVKHGDSADA